MSTIQSCRRWNHEDQLLNYLVNALDEKVALNLASNVEAESEDICRILTGAYADVSSVSKLCEKNEGSLHKTLILYHLCENTNPEFADCVEMRCCEKLYSKLCPSK